jgi:hypothetical protein
MAVIAREVQSMKVGDVAMGLSLLMAVVVAASGHTAEVFKMEYKHTLFLITEADIGVHLCHLRELALQRRLQDPESDRGTFPTRNMWPIDPGVTSEREQVLRDIWLCRVETEEAIRARLPEAQQELAKDPVAEEKLKGLMAAWLAALKMLPRTSLSVDALLAQQDSERQLIRQKQTELEVELFWSGDQPNAWTSRSSPES